MRRAPPPWRDETSRDEPAAWALEAVDRIEREAGERGLVVPPSFRAFFATPGLASRLRSCTACSFSFGDVAPSPGDDGAFLVRFYADQQDCVHWFLHLTPEGSHCVVAGVDEWPEAAPWPRDGEAPADDVAPEPADAADPTGDAAAAALAAELLRAIQAPLAVPSPDEEAPPATRPSGRIVRPRFAAPSFEAFMYRCWIENEIWFALNDRRPLTDAQRAYLAHDAR